MILAGQFFSYFCYKMYAAASIRLSWLESFKQLLYVSFINLLRSELHIKGCIEDNSKIIFLFLHENICCDPSLEPSR